MKFKHRIRGTIDPQIQTGEHKKKLRQQQQEEEEERSEKSDSDFV